QGLEGQPVEELHRHVEVAGIGLAEIVELDRVRVLELADDAALAHEARDDLRVLRVLGDDRLDRDLALLGPHLLLGGVDAAHAALAEDAGDLEPTADERADERILLFRLGQRRPALAAKTGAVVVRVVAGYALHASSAQHRSPCAPCASDPRSPGLA